MTRANKYTIILMLILIMILSSCSSTCQLSKDDAFKTAKDYFVAKIYENNFNLRYAQSSSIADSLKLENSELKGGKWILTVYQIDNSRKETGIVEIDCKTGKVLSFIEK
jgi:hypothetical protein